MAYPNPTIFDQSGGISANFGPNYVVGSGSSANAAVGTLNDGAGNKITVQAGLQVLYKCDSTLQAGSNTLNINGHGTDSLVQGSGTNSNLKTPFAAGAIIDVVFDGTRWQMLGRNQ